MIRNIKLTVCIIILLVFSGCKSKEYIVTPIEKTKIEYVHSIDSIYLRDSIYMSVVQKNDTVFVDKFKYVIREVHKLDTIHKTDSIPVIVEVPKIQTVNKLYFWQKLLMYVGGACLIVIGGIIIYKILSWKWKQLF